MFMSLFFYKPQYFAGDSKGTARRAKNHPVNGFLVPGLAATLPQWRRESHFRHQKEKTVRSMGFSFLLKPTEVGLERHGPKGKKPSSEWFFSARAGGATAPVAPGVPLPAPNKNNPNSFPCKKRFGLFG